MGFDLSVAIAMKKDIDKMRELKRAHPKEFKELDMLFSKHEDASFGIFNGFTFKTEEERERKEEELDHMLNLAEMFNLQPSTYHAWEQWCEDDDENEDHNYMLLFIDDELMLDVFYQVAKED